MVEHLWFVNNTYLHHIFIQWLSSTFWSYWSGKCYNQFFYIFWSCDIYDSACMYVIIGLGLIISTLPMPGYGTSEVNLNCLLIQKVVQTSNLYVVMSKYTTPKESIWEGGGIPCVRNGWTPPGSLRDLIRKEIWTIGWLGDVNIPCCHFLGREKSPL